MVIPFDQGRLQRLHIVAAHEGFCSLSARGQPQKNPPRAVSVPASRRHAPIFPPSVPARGRFVPLRPSRDPARLPRSAGRARPALRQPFSACAWFCFSVSFFGARLCVPVVFLCSLMRKTSRNEISPRRRGSAEAGASWYQAGGMWPPPPSSRGRQRSKPARGAMAIKYSGLARCRYASSEAQKRRLRSHRQQSSSNRRRFQFLPLR